MNKIKSFIKNPIILLLIIAIGQGLAFLFSNYLLPNFIALLPICAYSILICALLAYAWGKKQNCKNTLKMERAKNSVFINELLVENKEYHKKMINLINERDFLIAVLEQYGVNNIN